MAIVPMLLDALFVVVILVGRPYASRLDNIFEAVFYTICAFGFGLSLLQMHDPENVLIEVRTTRRAIPKRPKSPRAHVACSLRCMLVFVRARAFVSAWHARVYVRARACAACAYVCSCVRVHACVCGAGYDVGQLTCHVPLLGARSERCRGCDPPSGRSLLEDQRCRRRRLS